MRLIFMSWLLLLFCVGIGVSLWAGNHLTRAHPGKVGPLPEVLRARQLHFLSANGVRLSAWFAAGQPGRGAVLLLHGNPGDSNSMIARALFLHRRGMAVLLLDHQAHGESEGERTTFGYREAGDALAGLRQLAVLAPGEKRGAIGVSMGAAALVLADVHDQLSALVLESLFPTIEQAVDDRMALHLGPWGPWLSPLLLWQLEPRLGVPRAALRPISRMPLLHEPVLLAHGTEDRHTRLAEAESLYALLPGSKQFYPVPGAGHVDLHGFAPAAYEQQVGAFLSRYLDQGAPAE